MIADLNSSVSQLTLNTVENRGQNPRDTTQIEQMDSIISRLGSTSEAGEGWSFMGSALDALKIGDPMDFLRERENDTPLKDEGIIL